MVEVLRKETLMGPADHPAWHEVLKFAVDNGLQLGSSTGEDDPSFDGGLPAAEHSETSLVDTEVLKGGTIIEQSDLRAFAEQECIDPKIATVAWNLLLNVFVEKLAYDRDSDFYTQRHFFKHIPLRFENVPAPGPDDTSRAFTTEAISGLEFDSLVELIDMVDAQAVQLEDKHEAWRRVIPFITVRKDAAGLLRGFAGAWKQVDTRDK